MPSRFRFVLLGVLVAVLLAGAPIGFSPASAQEPPAADGPDVLPTPRAECGPGSNPETGAQGRVPRDEVLSGRAEEGYTCNTEIVSRFGKTGGYKVERYVDAAGRECAYYDTSLLFPLSATNVTAGQLTGVAVLDMTDPARPVQTATLSTPAMQSPHETLNLGDGPIEVSAFGDPGAGYAMSSASFVPERGEIWYSDGESGFYAIRLTNGVWPFPTKPAATESRPSARIPEAGRSGRGGRTLPATGAAAPLLVGLGALAGGLGLRRLRRPKP